MTYLLVHDPFLEPVPAAIASRCREFRRLVAWNISERNLTKVGTSDTSVRCKYPINHKIDTLKSKLMVQNMACLHSFLTRSR